MPTEEPGAFNPPEVRRLTPPVPSMAGVPPFASSGSGDLIEYYRKRPTACLYCSTTLLTREHPVGMAIGGRLHSPILCEHHNNVIANAVDGPYFERFAPVVAFLGIPRQDGQKGTAFAATFDDGSIASVKIDGRIPLKGLDAKTLDAQGKFVFAKGDLMLLDHLKESGKLADSALPVIALVEKPPPINFQIAADDLAVSVALKTALHFVAAFVCDIDRDAALALLPSVLGSRSAAPQYVRSTILMDENIFARTWPPRHEVTCYPAGDVTYVSVMHFGLHSYLVRLPFSVPLTHGLRYRQVLGEPEPLLDDRVEIQEIDWEHDTSDGELAQFMAYGAAWNRRVMEAAGRRDVRARIGRAIEGLETNTGFSGLSYFDRLKAELQIVGFAAAEVEQLLVIARDMRDKNRTLLDINDADLHIRHEQLT